MKRHGLSYLPSKHHKKRATVYSHVWTWAVEFDVLEAAIGRRSWVTFPSHIRTSFSFCFVGIICFRISCESARVGCKGTDGGDELAGGRRGRGCS
jgi:hypothetical protein